MYAPVVQLFAYMIAVAIKLFVIHSYQDWVAHLGQTGLYIPHYFLLVCDLDYLACEANPPTDSNPN